MTTMQKLLSESALAGAALAAFLPVAGPHEYARAAEGATALPAAVLDEAAGRQGLETLILAGGCFWGVQGAFQHVRGVLGAVSGYDGGTAGTADYGTVSTGTTDHAESVRITYDPRVVTYGQLLQVFLSVVTDPTQVDGQYPDHGRQYRSEIFATTPEQARIAAAYVSQLDAAKAFARPIATVVAKDSGFFPAEAYQQDYLTRHPDNPYNAEFDLPKLTALQTAFPDRFKPTPVLTEARQS